MSTDIENPNMNITHYVFVYCDCHDQGGVAIINNYEWLEMNEKNIMWNSKDIFRFLDTACVDTTMCGENIQCIDSWRCCGYMKYNSDRKRLSGIESVQTDFKRENGGWKFKYFKYELYNNRGLTSYKILPNSIKEFLTHLDNN